MDNNQMGNNQMDNNQNTDIAGQPGYTDAGGMTGQSGNADVQNDDVSAAMAARQEWERRQREIQDREWQSRQQQYNQQLVAERSPDGSATDAGAVGAGATGYTGQAGQAGQADQFGAASGQGGVTSGQVGQNGPGGPYKQIWPQQQNGQSYQSWQNNQGSQGVQGGQDSRDNQDGQQYFDYAAYQEHISRPQTYATGARAYDGTSGRAPDGAGGDKRGKRKTRFQILAAGLAGALVASAIFSAGFFAANFNRNPAETAQQTASAAATTTPTTEQQRRQSQLEDGQTPGGAAGSEAAANGGASSGGSSFLPGFPGFPGTGGASGAANGAAQDASKDAAQAEQRQSREGGSEFSALTLNPPSGDDMTITEIYQKNYPSIVGVRITVPMEGYRFGGFMMPGQEQSGEGSGIIVREDGYIMTNHHVIAETIDTETRKQLEGTKIEVFLPDDEDAVAYPATIVGYDQSTDLAMLKIEQTGMKAAELGDADQLEVGEFVVAIGNPGGMEYMSSVTFGVISGLNRSIQTEGYRDIQLIQTDAAINPGNSGGALINSKGQVIGVNSIKIASSSFEGLGFAIPINTAVEICDDLMNYTYVTGRPFIGITAHQQYTENLAEQYDMPKGVYVYEVEDGGPADTLLSRNDIIVKFNGVDVANFDALETEKNKCKPGDKATLQVYRDWSVNDYTSGRYVDVELTLGEKIN